MLQSVITYFGFIYATFATCNGAVTQSPCSRNSPGIQLHAISEDCSSYWICRNGLPKREKCPPGLLFDDITKRCDEMGSLNCMPTSMNGLSPSRQLAGGFLHPDCPKKDPNEPVIIPHGQDCGKFYICSGGMAHEKTCMAGLHFNRKLKVCDYPENTDCQPKLAYSEAARKCPTQQNPAKVSFLPHESDCTLYYMCANGKPILRNCPDGLHFNEKEEVCDYAFRAGCAQERELTEDPTNVVTFLTTLTMAEAAGSPSPLCPSEDGMYPIFFPDEKDCTAYYMCGNGLAYKFICPDELHFNNLKNVCDVPKEANCLDRQKRSIQKPTCPTSNMEILTILPHEKDCTKYYMCGSGAPIERQCPDGLHFNPTKEVCDFPNMAGCATDITYMKSFTIQQRARAIKRDISY